MASHKLKSCSIIGYGNHAKKIIKYINKNIHVFVKNIYHPSKVINNKFTNSLEEILKSDAIFILCPTNKHYFYLNYLRKKQYKGYIFCEKLPVSKIDHINKLIKFSYKKLYFNFNLEFSEISSFLKNNKFGNLKRVFIENSKPYLQKKNISKNWRVKDPKILITNLFPHYLYLIRKYLFKKNKNEFKFITGTKSKKTNIYDNISMIISDNQCLINVVLSYSGGLKKKYILNYDKTNVEIDDIQTKIFKPIYILNKKNKFKRPKLFKKYAHANIYDDSNRKSVNFFIKKMITKNFFLKSDYKLALRVNEEILRLKIKSI